MAKIKKFIDRVGCRIYPITHIDAVIGWEGKRLSQILEEIVSPTGLRQSVLMFDNIVTDAVQPVDTGYEGTDGKVVFSTTNNCFLLQVEQESGFFEDTWYYHTWKAGGNHAASTEYNNTTDGIKPYTNKLYAVYKTYTEDNQVHKYLLPCMFDGSNLVGTLDADVIKGWISEQGGSVTQVQSDWNQADATQPDYIKNKPSIPTKTSDLTNDSNFITSDDVSIPQILELKGYGTAPENPSNGDYAYFGSRGYFLQQYLVDSWQMVSSEDLPPCYFIYNNQTYTWKNGSLTQQASLPEGGSQEEPEKEVFSVAFWGPKSMFDYITGVAEGSYAYVTDIKKFYIRENSAWREIPFSTNALYIGADASTTTTFNKTFRWDGSFMVSVGGGGTTIIKDNVVDSTTKDSTNVPTTKAVYDALENKSSVFRCVANTGQAIPNGTLVIENNTLKISNNGVLTNYNGNPNALYTIEAGNVTEIYAVEGNTSSYTLRKLNQKEVFICKSWMEGMAGSYSVGDYAMDTSNNTFQLKQYNGSSFINVSMPKQAIYLDADGGQLYTWDGTNMWPWLSSGEGGTEPGSQDIYFTNGDATTNGKTDGTFNTNDNGVSPKKIELKPLFSDLEYRVGVLEGASVDEGIGITKMDKTIDTKSFIFRDNEKVDKIVNSINADIDQAADSVLPTREVYLSDTISTQILLNTMAEGESSVPDTIDGTLFIISSECLMSSNVTVPDNCILQFTAEGKIVTPNKQTFTLTGSNTDIQAERHQIFSPEITIGGTWNVHTAYPEWFGAKGKLPELYYKRTLVCYNRSINTSGRTDIIIKDMPLPEEVSYPSDYFPHNGSLPYFYNGEWYGYGYLKNTIVYWEDEDCFLFYYKGRYYVHWNGAELYNTYTMSNGEIDFSVLPVAKPNIKDIVNPNGDYACYNKRVSNIGRLIACKYTTTTAQTIGSVQIPAGSEITATAISIPINTGNQYKGFDYRTAQYGADYALTSDYGISDGNIGVARLQDVPYYLFDNTYYIPQEGGDLQYLDTSSKQYITFYINNTFGRTPVEIPRQIYQYTDEFDQNHPTYYGLDAFNRVFNDPTDDGTTHQPVHHYKMAFPYTSIDVYYDIDNNRFLLHNPFEYGPNGEAVLYTSWRNSNLWNSDSGVPQNNKLFSPVFHELAEVCCVNDLIDKHYLDSYPEFRVTKIYDENRQSLVSLVDTINEYYGNKVGDVDAINKAVTVAKHKVLLDENAVYTITSGKISITGKNNFSFDMNGAVIFKIINNILRTNSQDETHPVFCYPEVRADANNKWHVYPITYNILTNATTETKTLVYPFPLFPVWKGESKLDLKTEAIKIDSSNNTIFVNGQFAAIKDGSQNGHSAANPMYGMNMWGSEWRLSASSSKIMAFSVAGDNIVLQNITTYNVLQFSTVGDSAVHVYHDKINAVRCEDFSTPRGTEVYYSNVIAGQSPLSGGGGDHVIYAQGENQHVEFENCYFYAQDDKGGPLFGLHQGHSGTRRHTVLKDCTVIGGRLFDGSLSYMNSLSFYNCRLYQIYDHAPVTGWINGRVKYLDSTTNIPQVNFFNCELDIIGGIITESARTLYDANSLTENKDYGYSQAVPFSVNIVNCHIVQRGGSYPLLNTNRAVTVKDSIIDASQTDTLVNILSSNPESVHHVRMINNIIRCGRSVITNNYANSEFPILFDSNMIEFNPLGVNGITSKYAYCVFRGNTQGAGITFNKTVFKDNLLRARYVSQDLIILFTRNISVAKPVFKGINKSNLGWRGVVSIHPQTGAVTYREFNNYYMPLDDNDKEKLKNITITEPPANYVGSLDSLSIYVGAIREGWSFYCTDADKVLYLKTIGTFGDLTTYTWVDAMGTTYTGS